MTGDGTEKGIVVTDAQIVFTTDRHSGNQIVRIAVVVQVEKYFKPAILPIDFLPVKGQEVMILATMRSSNSPFTYEVVRE